MIGIRGFGQLAGGPMSIRFISGFSRPFCFFPLWGALLTFVIFLVGRWEFLETGARLTLGLICSTTRLEAMGDELQ